MSKKKALILDTTAFIVGFTAFDLNDEVCTVPDVQKELAKSSMARVRLNTAIRASKLRLLEPDIRALKKAEKASKEVGDLLSLSEVDMKILALAIQLREEGYAPTIITDDYSIQNVAKKLEINYESVAMHGIKYHLKWLLYCPACHKKYPSDYKFEICENCGTKLKRKPLSKDPT